MISLNHEKYLQGGIAMGRLENKVALVVGATSGIGAEVARAYGEEGAKIVVGGRTEDRGKEVANEIKNNGGEASFVQIDITDQESVKNAVKTVTDKYGTIDVLYNGAGAHDGYSNILETDVETYDKIMDVNLKGIFLVTKEVLPIMLENGKGKVINVGSQGTEVAGPGGITYVTTKHAIEGFTKQLSYNFGSKGINANVLAPGFVYTPLVEGVEDERLDGIPAGRGANVEEISPLAVYLASDESDYMHGSTLVIDGGWNIGR